LQTPKQQSVGLLHFWPISRHVAAAALRRPIPAAASASAPTTRNAERRDAKSRLTASKRAPSMVERSWHEDSGRRHCVRSCACTLRNQREMILAGFRERTADRVTASRRRAVSVSVRIVGAALRRLQSSMHHSVDLRLSRQLADRHAIFANTEHPSSS
jgi:hypothetical protein